VKCNPGYAIAVALGFFAVATPNVVVASPLDWFKFGPTEAVDVVTISYGSFNNLSVYAGQYVGTLAATQPGLSAPTAQTFNTFCVDLNDEVSVNQEYEVAPTSTNIGLANGAAIAYLYSTFGQTLISGSNVNGSGLDAADYAAALQLAIWDELANNGHAPTVGSPLQYSGLNPGVAAQVQNFLTLASHNSGNEIWLDSDVPQPPGYTAGQCFLAPKGLGLLASAPEPSTVFLAGAAFCCWVTVLCGRGYRIAVSSRPLR
jgi:hypothetical protein